MSPCITPHFPQKEQATKKRHVCTATRPLQVFVLVPTALPWFLSEPRQQRSLCRAAVPEIDRQEKTSLPKTRALEEKEKKKGGSPAFPVARLCLCTQLLSRREKTRHRILLIRVLLVAVSVACPGDVYSRQIKACSFIFVITVLQQE